MEHTEYENVVGKVLIYQTKRQIFSYLRSKHCTVHVDEFDEIFMKGGYIPQQLFKVDKTDGYIQGVNFLTMTNC